MTSARSCATCGVGFALSAIESSWLRTRLRRIGAPFHPPGRCRDCETAAVLARRADMRRALCAACGGAFPISKVVPEGRAVRCRSCMMEADGG